MRTTKSLTTFVLISCLIINGCARQQKPSKNPEVFNQTLSFNQVTDQVQQLSERYDADDILIVLDIDNTLISSHIDLGGDIWYQWQTNKLNIKPTPEQKVACLFTDAIGLLYELGPMDLIEHQVPATVKSWQKNGHVVFALTSRSPNYRSATERELAVHGIDFSLNPLQQDPQTPTVLSGRLKRPYSYINGIMMTTGMNKGEMLQFILNQTKRKFKAVVFVDDSESNINNITNAYTYTDIDMKLFHYTRVEHDRIETNGTVLTQQQADEMADLWDELNTTLNQIYPQRAERQAEGCVGIN